MLTRSWPGLRRHVPEKIKEEVVLLFLKVVLFENSNKEGGVDPFLPRSNTQLTYLSCHFCRPRSRFQFRWLSPASTFCNASRRMSGTLKMDGEKAGDLSSTGERKDWLSFRKIFHKVFDEKNMGWAITTGTIYKSMNNRWRNRGHSQTVTGRSVLEITLLSLTR